MPSGLFNAPPRPPPGSEPDDHHPSPRRTVREHPALVAELRNAGATVQVYDDYDYVTDPALRAALGDTDQMLASVDPDDLD